MASRSRHKRQFQCRLGRPALVRGVSLCKFGRPWMLFGLAWICSEQMLGAQQPTPLSRLSVPPRGNYSNLESSAQIPAVVSRVDNSARTFVAVRRLQTVQNSETIREALQPQIEAATQENENPSPEKTLPPGGLADTKAAQQNNSRRGPSSFLPKLKPIGEIDINIAAKPKANDNSVPPMLSNMNQSSEPVRDTTFAFDGRAGFGISVQNDLVPYQPLYFEEVNLERYGRAHCGQAVCSMVRFFGTVPMMPYLMTIDRPNRPMYWNWPYEAGWGAPRVRELPPFSWKAATVQALAITGAAAVIP
jgi:hypothetical protein